MTKSLTKAMTQKLTFIYLKCSNLKHKSGKIKILRLPSQKCRPTYIFITITIHMVLTEIQRFI